MASEEEGKVVSVLEHIFAVMGVQRFPGLIPYLLTRANAEELARNEYAKSYKYDGTRALLFSDGMKFLHLVTRSGKSIILGRYDNIAYGEWVLDCEVVDSEVIIFDTLHVTGEDWRATLPNLYQRVARAEEFIARADLVVPPDVKMTIKNYFPSAQSVFPPDSRPRDGMIFTLVHKNAVFKYKPEQTVDFMLGAAKEGLIRTDAGYTVITNKIEDLPETAVAGDIVECVVEAADRFRYYRTRLDKADANYVAVMRDILDFLRDPIAVP